MPFDLGQIPWTSLTTLLLQHILSFAHVSLTCLNIFRRPRTKCQGRLYQRKRTLGAGHVPNFRSAGYVCLFEVNIFHQSYIVVATPQSWFLSLDVMNTFYVKESFLQCMFSPWNVIFYPCFVPLWTPTLPNIHESNFDENISFIFMHWQALLTFASLGLGHKFHFLLRTNFPNIKVSGTYFCI